MIGRIRPGYLASEKLFFTRCMFRRQYYPALFSALTMALADIADAVMVGHRMGPVGLAAIAFALPVFMVYYVIAYSFGLGASIRYAGEMSDGREARALAGIQGVLITLAVLGLGIVVFGNLWLRALLRMLGADPANARLFSIALIYLQLLLDAAPLFFVAYSLEYYMRNAEMEREASVSASVGECLRYHAECGACAVLQSRRAGRRTCDTVGRRHHHRHGVLLPVETPRPVVHASHKAGFRRPFARIPHGLRFLRVLCLCDGDYTDQ